MGKTYNQKSRKLDDDFTSERSGKHARHTSGRKTGGMKTLNSYVEEYYEFDESPFDDELEINDEIQIQHTNIR
jgi:hypothetical protein